MVRLEDPAILMTTRVAGNTLAAFEQCSLAAVASDSVDL